MALNKSEIGIGLMGLGTIGTGVAKALLAKSSYLNAVVGRPLVLKKILERDTKKHGSLGLETARFTAEFTEIVSDPGIDIVIELIGGEHPAFEFVKSALSSGKPVVTANKEVISKHGSELLALAHKHGVELRYEASVGGGIPLIATFKEDLAANDICAIHAIVNGTTNYILTRMSQEGIDFSVALKKAQELGYAEADPAKDVEGLDAAFKIAILASLAFRSEVLPQNVYCEGISKLEARDFKYARELGYAIKLLAIAKRSDRSIEVRVHPVFVPEDFLLAKVDGVYNAIQVEGDLVGKVIFYGQGAGPSATSSAVIADVLAIARSLNYGPGIQSILPITVTTNIKSMADVVSRCYFRMTVTDAPGVLARISKVFGDHGISISSVIQKEIDPTDQTAEIVIMTHPAREKAVQEGLKELGHLPITKKINNFIRVEG